MNERGKDVSFSLVTTIMLTCFLQCSDGGQVWLKMLPISDLGLCGNLLVLVMCHWEKCVNIVHNFCTIVHKPLLLDIFFACEIYREIEAAVIVYMSIFVIIRNFLGTYADYGARFTCLMLMMRSGYFLFVFCVKDFRSRRSET